MKRLLARFRKQPRPVRIPIQPAHEATRVEFVHKGRVVAICLLSDFTMDSRDGSTAVFRDLSYFKRYEYRLAGE